MEHYVINMLKHIDYPNGFYIESGSNNGFDQSYTYELEKKGWRGILIEPSKMAFDECVRIRSNENIFVNCALVGDENVKEVKGDFDGNMMSSVDGKRTGRPAKDIVKARTLNDILSCLGIVNIDLASLDMEGYELEALKGFDLQRYKPKFLVIEVYNHLIDELWAMMRLNNYELIENLTGYNKKEYPNWDGTYNDYLFKRKE